MNPQTAFTCHVATIARTVRLYILMKLNHLSFEKDSREYIYCKNSAFGCEFAIKIVKSKVGEIEVYDLYSNGFIHNHANVEYIGL
jgi:hypothetical protein